MSTNVLSCPNEFLVFGPYTVTDLYFRLAGRCGTWRLQGNWQLHEADPWWLEGNPPPPNPRGGFVGLAFHRGPQGGAGYRGRGGIRVGLSRYHVFYCLNPRAELPAKCMKQATIDAFFQPIASASSSSGPSFC